ncbi:tigger transposable element-derived protein 4 [Trichinella spiralis]|uniref:tigger transposable element-derived protein 4 n=1 Tax=Trichinella spiralis TaxID=6334 RepID=UPI0001EFE775|nr:tigger transposable element-derived protein 4 [Trichinella spiralis]
MEKEERRQITTAQKLQIIQTSGNFAELEEVLQKWFKQVRTSNVPVDGTVVRSKAAELAHIMGINDFKASNGWINRFRQRHGLVYRSIRGEAAGVNRYTVDTWKDRLQVLLNDYRPDDVFSADEVRLFYRILPDKTLTFKGENCSGDKLSKERLTVLLCCNESGTEMLKPLTFPCTYHANSNSWITHIMQTRFNVDENAINQLSKIDNLCSKDDCTFNN